MGSDGTVVVVDDEAEILDIICQVLDDDGYRVLCMEHPRRAMEINVDVHPSLYLLDLMLPGMSGIQLAGEIHKQNVDHAPMIAMSASSSMLNKARESGLFEDTLSKPFDLAQLLDRVECYAS